MAAWLDPTQQESLCRLQLLGKPKKGNKVQFLGRNLVVCTIWYKLCFVVSAIYISVCFIRDHSIYFRIVCSQHQQSAYSQLPIISTGPIIGNVLISGGSYYSFLLLHSSSCHTYCLKKKWIVIGTQEQLNWFNLVYGQFGPCNLHHTLNFCPDQSGKNQMQQNKRIAKVFSITFVVDYRTLYRAFFYAQGQ